MINGLLRGAFRLAEHDAEDAFQDVLTRVYLSLSTVRDESALRAWIASITRNVALDALRRGSREVPAGETLDEQAFTEPLLTVDEALTVRAALERLPDHHSEILERFFVRDESYRTIAADMDLPQGTIASRISRALSALRIEFESSGKIAQG
jgi:RNA polymerase sigma-70 factor (ECF subfamily)